MKDELSNGLFILMIVLLVGVSVKLLPTKDKKAADTQSSAFLLNDSTLAQAIIYLRPLIATQSVGTLAQSLKNVNLERVLELVDEIVNKEPLSRDQKLLFLFALIFNYDNDLNAQFQILDRLAQSEELQKGTPILLVAVRSEQFNDAIPTLLDWARIKKKEQLLIEQALNGAVQENDLASLEILAEYKIPITNKQASQALLQVVRHNKDPEFIPFLVEQGADVNIVDGKRTPLIYATEQNNLSLVKALLQAGASATQFVDPQVGTPLQIAIENRYADIDMILREHGAGEN